MPDVLPDPRKRLPESKSLDDSTDEIGTSGAISTPDLSDSLKAKNRAIRDVAQAKNIYDNLEQSGRLRSMKNARIAARYASEKPYCTKKLEEEGLGWKANFSTSPMVSLVNKVVPRFSQAVEASKYLTNSSLPETVEGADIKTEAFRREVTATIRSWSGWKNFLTALSMENSLYGFCVAFFGDEFSWYPKAVRQDRSWLPTSTTQTVGDCQLVVIEEVFILNKLFEMIADKEAAKARGWNIKNVVEALNTALPEHRRSTETNAERAYEDLRRESTVGGSYESGALVVNVIHVYATEIDGKVSHYIFEKREFKELFTSEDQHDKMEDAVAFFSLEYGSGTMHSSRGIGRTVYNLAAVLDRARNDVIDRFGLAGKLLITGDDKMLKKFKMTLWGSTVLIGSQFTVSEVKVESAVEPFLQLDAFVSSLLNELAGTVSPNVIQGERVTAAAVNLAASKDEEVRDILITRYLNQFTELMGVLQRRLCSADVTEPEAKEMQKRLLEIMSRKELKQISETAPAETVKDFSGVERQQIVLIAQESAGNPLYDQRELQRQQLTARVNDEFAETVLLPEEDPTVTAEQTRLQQLELLIIAGQGSEVPISPRDAHEIHLGVLMPVLEKTAQQAVEDPSAVGILQAVLAHAQAHVAAAESAGMKDVVKKFEPTLKKLAKAIPELSKNADQSQQLVAGAPPGEVPLDNAAPMQ